MSRFKKVGTGTIQYIQEVGCSNDCSKHIQINKGLPLPCKEFTFMESGLLRMRALEDEQLFASGFTRIIDRSAIGDDLRVKGLNIDIGDIRTEASGARGLRECKFNFEGMEIDQWEQKFYVVNTNKHLKLCPKDLIGSSLQSMIGDKMTDYDEFADTDLADILIGSIIEKYTKDFVAKFVLLSVFDSEASNQHGDDGVLAKAWFASKGQYFHTVQFDFSALAAGTSLQAIEGGKKYEVFFDDVGNSDGVLLSFVSWVNSLKDTKEYQYAASVNLTTKIVTVVSRFAVEKVTLRTGIGTGGAQADWSSVTCSTQSAVPTTVIQNAMPINDVPLMFNYETIDETNFVPLFKKYIKEFTRYLHRNGFNDIPMSSVRIGIDPELMLEKDDAQTQGFLTGCSLPLDFMTQIGLSDSLFVPLNALNATGLFFMTVNENILIFGDGENAGNGLPGTGTVKITEVCDDGQFGVIFDNPIGTAVEHFGAFASNLCNSWFVIDNDLDNKEPYENTRYTLPCYHDACVAEQLQISCDIDAVISSSVVYDADGDQTLITVTVEATTDASTVTYDLGYSLSDGTSSTGITSSEFVVTVPGDQTASGLVLNVFGQVSGSGPSSGAVSTKYCASPVAYSTQLGSTADIQICEWTSQITTDEDSTADVSVGYTLAGSAQTQALIDPALDIFDPTDWSAIEDEIEAILPGSIVALTEAPTEGDVTITISNVSGLFSLVTVTVDTTGTATTTSLNQTCE